MSWAQLLAWLFKKPQTVPVSITPIPMPTNADKLYNTAKACLGKDMVDDPGVDPSVGCADAVNSVFKLAFGGEIGGGASTATMYEILKSDPRFELSGYAKGNIVISPTGTSIKGAPHGHVGICGLYGILSNNSMNGLWEEYYTEQSWVSYYQDKLGFPVFYFSVK